MCIYLTENRPRNTHWKETLFSYDIFATRVPEFNFEGRDKVGSIIGLCSTAVFLTIMIGFSSLKFKRFVDAENPLISEALDIDFYTSSRSINL